MHDLHDISLHMEIPLFLIGSNVMQVMHVMQVM
jgi:hypothetical protein